MKQLWTFLLAMCLLLTGCSPASPVETPEESQTPQEIQTSAQPETKTQTEPWMSAEEFPRIDGSTANLPLMAAVLSAVTGMEQSEAENTVSCTTTPTAWTQLASGYTDLLLVYEAAEDTQAALDEIGTELEITPIGLDALVFIVNAQNPVQSVTQDQLRQIYTGQITNWKDLGGEDLDIQAFQRDPTSGSQSLFRKLLMPDQEPMEAPTAFIPSDMGSLIEDLASYNNDGSAIGYSVFYYASYMYAKPGLRFLAVDSVTPSDETIADQSYPLLNPFYVAIRADEPADSPARQVRDWLLTDAGTEVISAAGYIPYSAS